MKNLLMKQFALFALILVGLAAAYQYYPPFAALFDDVVQYADLEPELRVAEKSATATKGVDKNTDKSIVKAAKLAAPDIGRVQERASMAENTMAQKPAAHMPAQASQPAMTTYPAFSEAPQVQSDKATKNNAAAMTKRDGFRPLSPVPPSQPVPAPKSTQSALPKKPAQPVERMPSEMMSPSTLPTQKGAVVASDKAAAHQALEGLAQARTAWQQGNAESAISRYAALMAQYPNHPDFAGELGNIYYAQGNRTQAVEAYAQAFQRLTRMQDYRRAWQILAVIRKLDYQRAGQLERAFTGLY